MALEYVEEGKKYKLELLCIHNKEKVIVFETPTGDHIPLRIADLECVSPANDTKNTEPAPKYDPNRKFRKGDKVSPRFWCDRPPMASVYCGNTAFVLEDGVYEVKEDERNPFVLIDYNGNYVFVPACHLELITPVEELEPYHVVEDSVSFNVVKGNRIPVFFCKGSHPHAKAAAEAECARLNSEYRKEMGK